VQGPEKYLKELKIGLPCAVDPSHPAILDEAHRAFVNYETYYFATDANMNTFIAAPYKYTGKVTDPVTRDRFIPTGQSPRRSFEGRLFYFESDQTAKAFDSDRERYGTLTPGMRPRNMMNAR